MFRNFENTQIVSQKIRGDTRQGKEYRTVDFLIFANSLEFLLGILKLKGEDSAKSNTINLKM